MLIRHAEKAIGNELAVGPDGRPDVNSLSVTGWQRAGALVPYFALAGPTEGLYVARPEIIFAARPHADHHSNRPLDTVRPLAEKLRLPIDLRWSDADDPMQISDALSILSTPALVCWRHDSLPVLGKAIARSVLLRDDDIPHSWPADRYDVVWSFIETANGWSFHQVPQRLLGADQAEPLAS